MVDLVREKYLSRIRPFYRDPGLIKVITGVRRCGKSTVMRQIIDELTSSGVDPGMIAYLDLDSKEYRRVSNADDLEAAIDAVLPGEGDGRYLFIDEVQNVDGFEKLVNAYRGDGVSVFITGSNSYLLSGELVTKLTGRYIELDVYPFSLAEVRDFKRLNGQTFEAREELRDYMVNGGLPGRFVYDAGSQQDYVRAMVDEVIGKDVIRRNKVRGRSSFEAVLRYVLSTPSVTVSSTSVAKYLRSEGVSILPDTVNRYLDMIFSSKLAMRCDRVDIVGKKALRTLYKSYVADPALCSFYAGPGTNQRMGAMMENLVHNELLSRGYRVSVGKLRDLEVDFVVSRGTEMALVQVAYLLASEETEDREEAPLLAARTACPKYIISMDPIPTSRNGVIRLNLLDFLLGEAIRLGPARC